jgi:ribosomal protein S4
VKAMLYILRLIKPWLNERHRQVVKFSDVIILRPTSGKTDYFKRLDDVSPAPADIPSWLKVNRKKFEVIISSLPTREDAEADIKEQLIVEYYSR